LYESETQSDNSVLITETDTHAGALFLREVLTCRDANTEGSCVARCKVSVAAHLVVAEVAHISTILEELLSPQ
jgi:hypothetical protein